MICYIPIWMARRAARREKDCCASVPQHPYDSTARGMHTHPSSAHFESLSLCFLASANRAEDPHLTPASVKVIGLSGEVILRSKAAGLPRCQLLTSTSAGRECSLSYYYYYFCCEEGHLTRTTTGRQLVLSNSCHAQSVERLQRIFVRPRVNYSFTLF